MKKKDKNCDYFPHNFKQEIKILSSVNIPEIIISQNAFNDIKSIVSQCGNNEISWLGSVEKIENIYYINNVYLLQQTVSIASIEIEPEAIAELATRLIMDKKLQEVNKLRFWGHVHPNNSTSPSMTDEKQMKLFVNEQTDFYIRGIFGRKGRAEFSVFDYVQKLQFDDVEWEIQNICNEERDKQIKAQIDKYVKTNNITYLPFYSSTNGFGYNLDKWGTEFPT